MLLKRQQDINASKTWKTTPLFNVLMFSLFWALQIFTAKLGFTAGAEVVTFQALSIGAAFAVLTVLILPKVGAEMARLFRFQPRIFWMLYFANGIQSGLGTSLSLVGIALTDAINAGFLVKLATVTTILFATIFLKERLSSLKILIVIMMLLGAYLLTTKGQMLLPRIGDLFILSACVCWSLGNVLVRKILNTQPVQSDVVTMQKPLASLPVLLVLISIAVFFPLKLGSQRQLLSCCAVSGVVVIIALASGFCLAMAWIYLYRTLKIATASYMTLMSMLTPVIVSLLAVIFLRETLVLVQISGALMIILAGMLIYFSDIATS